jgi:hypothetical protein
MATPAYFQADFFKAGQHITYSGFSGVVVRHYSEGMWEVRLPGGVACVSGAHIQVA